MFMKRIRKLMPWPILSVKRLEINWNYLFTPMDALTSPAKSVIKKLSRQEKSF
jgi:hypothetical protein